MPWWTLADAALRGRLKKPQVNEEKLLERFAPEDRETIKELGAVKIINTKDEHVRQDYRESLDAFLSVTPREKLAKFVSHILKYGGYGLSATQINGVTEEIVTDVVSSRKPGQKDPQATRLHEGFILNSELSDKVIAALKRYPISSNQRDAIKVILKQPEQFVAGLNGYSDLIRKAKEGYFEQKSVKKRPPRKP
jgi:hypothetical protein